MSSATRSAVESLVGHPLGDEDVVYVAALSAEATGDLDRAAAWDELEDSISEMQRHASRSGLTAEQIDALVDVECAAVRYRSGGT